MSSIVEGYNYDIFISYRQKDNLPSPGYGRQGSGERWVSEFVEALKTELESTFKEEISVYFDINPHDGLLETHDVDESLKEKLKCLIFIPIISRTYCDPKSFAWEHEFKAFFEQASKDQFGLKVRLSNGNVANRILPVRIFDLDTSDIKLCESLLGSVLRGIEFIYKEPGVNRPLRVNEENPHENLNHTTYRNQVNKVANAIKEIITAIEPQEQKHEAVLKEVIKPVFTLRKNQKITLFAASVIALAFIIAGLFFIPKLSKSKGQVEKSIAVLPFKLLSDEPDKQYLADGMMEAITLHLSKIKDMRVMSRTSVEQYRGTTKTIHAIGQELNVDYLIEGSFQKFGDNTRLIVQLIKTSEESHVWANEYNSKWKDVFSLQSEVAQRIASELMVVLTPEEIEKMVEKPTENLEAYQAYLKGRYYAGQPHFSLQDWTQALQSYQDATEIDTSFALAYGELACAHARLIFLRQDLSALRFEKANQAAAKALRLGSDQPRVHLALGYYYLYAYRDEDQALKHLEIAEKSLPNDVEILVEKAAIIVTRGQWEEYIHLLEKAQQVSPHDVSIITDLAEGYWVTRRLRNTIDACNQAISLSPNSLWPYLFKAFGYWSWKGPCKESGDALEHVPSTHEWYLFSWWFQETGEGNYQAALQLMSDTSVIWGTNNKMWAIPRTMFNAFIYDYLDKQELALANYKAAMETLENKVADIPNDPRYHSSLGIAYAGLGKKEEAIREGLKAEALLPVSRDAMYGLGILQDLAIIYTMVGEYDMALDQLDKLLSIPSWFTPVWLGWEIRFAPLKSYPGYKELLTKHTID
jgi:TolB-like protein/Flp pilus assembly protein TadD